jgi:RPA family protein
MKKFDKEYSTQYTPEKDYLLQNGIKPSFVKTINEVTTYKYTKTSELFKLLAIFYTQK